MHLGNVRTALFNALLAKNQGGHFLLRIEDTDQARSQEDYTDVLLQDLEWLGLLWQEGPRGGGEQGPYWQSQRGAIYDRYFKQLQDQGSAYPCFCSEQELAISRKLQLASGHAPRYAGGCDRLSAEQVASRINEGAKPTLRFKVPLGQVIEFNDLVRGQQRFNSGDLGDFVIRRADGTAAFLFCNALDDALMGVTHALRGEDHLTNTPRQILLLQALQMVSPTYGHIALIVGADGSPLSKRHGSRSVKELREEGYLSLAIVNYLARLGHYYADNRYMVFAELAQSFSSDHLGAAPAHYDQQQLLYWQKEAIMASSNPALWEWCGHQVQSLVPEGQVDTFIETIRSNVCFPKDALHWANIFYTQTWKYEESATKILKQAGKEFFAEAWRALIEQGSDYAGLVAHLQQQLGVKGKALFLPIRVALTGEVTGPDMLHIVKLLNRDALRLRLQKVQEVIAC